VLQYAYSVSCHLNIVNINLLFIRKIKFNIEVFIILQGDSFFTSWPPLVRGGGSRSQSTTIKEGPGGCEPSLRALVADTL
jgi:hypothetical protein